MSQDSPEIENARQVEAVYQNAAFTRVMESVVGELFVRWLATDPADKDGREAIYATAKGVEAINDRFQMEIAPLEMARAEEEIHEEEKRAEEDRRDRE